MIQRLNYYGWYIEVICLVLMLFTVGIAAGMVITATLEQQAQSSVLRAEQAIERGWPAAWGE